MLPERVESKVERTDECWIWTGSRQANGYGYTSWWINGRWGHARTHRLFYEEYVGPIPAGMEVDHTCKVRACCKPDHLRIVTHAENLGTRDHRGPARTMTCKHGHPWTNETTYFDPRGNRSCRQCRTERVRQSRARRRQ